MIQEFDMLGVLVPALLVWALLALVVWALARRLLQRLGFYRWVWHRSLFDLALYILILGGVRLLDLVGMPT